jgi:thiol:disulfide interchange protein DsbD
LTFDGIRKDWHMYSQFTPDGGPASRSYFKREFNLVGKAKKAKLKRLIMIFLK